MHSVDSDPAVRAFNAAVRFIANQPGGADRLLTQHHPDEQGRCCGCGKPGYGTPDAPWPCIAAKVAQIVKARG